MYLKNPNTKVSYSFRINPELLEILKEYATATNQTLPETLNYLLSKSIDGIITTNTYLKQYDGILINIPFMYNEVRYEPLVDSTRGLEVFHRGTTNYLDFNTEGLTYEVKLIPNNLDTWFDDKGYYSNNGLRHEGVSLLIVPELILNPDLNLSVTAITNCLKFIYFQIDTKDNIEVKNISYKDCFRRLKKAGNNDLLHKFYSIDKTIYNYSLLFSKEFDKDPEPNIDNYRVKIYEDLLEYARKYNDGNILSLEELPEIELNNENTENSTGNLNGNKEIQLEEENQKLQERVQALENQLMDINKLLKDL